MLSMFESRRYASLALALRDEFQGAAPFPHVIIDDFLPREFAEEVAECFPSPDSRQISKWKYHENDNTRRWFLEDFRSLPSPLKQLASALGTRPFMQFLTTLTDIPSLLLDPYFIGGGAMSTPRGGFLKVHADFNWHALLQAWRRVNVLVYLTPRWQVDWGGQLELWSRDGKRCQETVDYRFNRAVIFSTTSDSFHGQPSPLECPMGVNRNIFSSFYYSSQRGEGTEVDPHFTKYALDESPYGKQVFEELRAKGEASVHREMPGEVEIA